MKKPMTGLERSICCVECGRVFPGGCITYNHLRLCCGLTLEEYRKRYGPRSTVSEGYRQSVSERTRVSTRAMWDDPEHRRRRKTSATYLPKGESGFNVVYYNYKWGARRRGLVFGVSKEEFATFTAQRCHYCGVPPSQIQRVNGGGVGDYIYTGIDRMDNGAGYTMGNMVACCGKCNRLKGKRSYTEFLSWVRHVSEHQTTASGREISDAE